jgi:hypothetical protein
MESDWLAKWLDEYREKSHLADQFASLFGHPKAVFKNTKMDGVPSIHFFIKLMNGYRSPLFQ